MRVFITLVVVAALAACESMPGFPGYISERTSQFDNSKEITVEPAGVRGEGLTNPFSLGAQWTSRAPDTVVLVVRVLGDYQSIDSKQGLQFNIDNNILSLDSPQAITQLDATQGPGTMQFRSSEKRFPIALKDFDRIVHSKGTGVKVNTPRGYLEGRLIEDQPMSALESLRKFRQTIPR
jgi:hypothetical protein